MQNFILAFFALYSRNKYNSDFTTFIRDQFFLVIEDFKILQESCQQSFKEYLLIAVILQDFEFFDIFWVIWLHSAVDRAKMVKQLSENLIMST